MKEDNFSSETKRFPTRVILTVTTGRLLTKSKGQRDNGISDLYELLGWVTGDAPFTHQLGRFAEECKPHILKLYPEIAQAGEPLSLQNLDMLLATSNNPGQTIEEWLLWVYTHYGLKGEYEITKLPNGTHQFKNPINELGEMMGKEIK